MAPSPIPAPLPIWAKVILQLAPFAAGFLYDLATHASSSSDVDALEWRRIHCRFDNLGSSDAADDAYVTFDLVNITGGNVDSSWTTSDYTTCEALFDTFWGSVASYQAANCKLIEYRWYRRKFNDYGDSQPFQKMGPPERVTTKSIVGTGANQLPPQAALSVSERTAFPGHWGRFYIPGISTLQVGPTGRPVSSCYNAAASASQTLYAGLGTAEFYPVVPVTQVNKQPNRGLLTVSSIQVDDTFDVIRSRRYRAPTVRVVKP